MSEPEAMALRVVVPGDDPAAVRAARDAVGWRDWWMLEVQGGAGAGRDPEGADPPIVVRPAARVRLRPHALVRIRQELESRPASRRQLVWDGLLRRALPGIGVAPAGSGSPPAGAPETAWTLPEGVGHWPVGADDAEILGDRVAEDEAEAFALGVAEGRAAADPERAGERAPYLHLLLEWYVVDRDPRHLWMWTGLVAGLTRDAGPDAEALARLRTLADRGRADWEREDAVRPYLAAWALDALEERLAGAKKRAAWRLPWDRAYAPPRPRGGAAGWAASTARRLLRPLLTSR